MIQFTRLRVISGRVLALNGRVIGIITEYGKGIDDLSYKCRGDFELSILTAHIESSINYCINKQ